MFLLFLMERAGLLVALDTALLLGLASPAPMIGLVAGVSHLGDSVVRIGVAVAATAGLLIARRWRTALALALAVAGGMLLNTAIKLLVLRPRPLLLEQLDRVTSSSFPSGHAANSAILYLALSALLPARHRRAALLAVGVLVLAIGLSRIALAVHWPSDVLAGWLVGTGWLSLWWNRLAAGPRAVDRI